ncbi:ArsR family transcriptional regulator [Parashewanella spongiae]|uniref:ArsR family transcriptional regulator n=1 Tax=Parashewanella spongiae TaxID=342950 RepID=A0A3A6U5H0_9GAMM|nr:metalloregulator ArsR/SmtB family transcription factor [Parashewanella spongiae]MCL1078536.1 metalloregulator ArsR/SmtB family transcription factor [Parashewanella spongiae]RJY13446.1 ArsR family transcriptional regulator [Parashewanella spongiae]
METLSLFKALSDQTRLTCVLLIHQQQELCVCELMAALDESQPKVSRHLALLKKQKILLDRRQEQWVFYRLNPELPHWYRTMLSDIITQQSEIIQAPFSHLEAMGNRPQRQVKCC